MAPLLNMRIQLQQYSQDFSAPLRLKADREQFESFIYRQTKETIKDGIFLELMIWEDFLNAMSQTRSQDEYN